MPTAGEDGQPEAARAPPRVSRIAIAARIATTTSRTQRRRDGRAAGPGIGGDGQPRSDAADFVRQPRLMPIGRERKAEGDRDRGDRRVTGVAHQALLPRRSGGSRVVPGSSAARASPTSVGCRAADWTSVADAGADASVGAEPAIGSSRPAGDARAPLRPAAGLWVGSCSRPAAATAPSGEPTPHLLEPIEAVATHDGVQVALGVDPARVAPGGDVAATVVVRNGAPGAVTWQGGGCELQGQFTVTPLGQAAPAPAGQCVAGRQGRDQGARPARGHRDPDPRAARVRPPDDVAFGCTSDLAFNELQPGAETRANVVWVASTAAGVPVPAGDYEVAVTFPYVGRGLAGPPLDFDFADDLTPVTARLVITRRIPGLPVPPAEAARWTRSSAIRRSPPRSSSIHAGSGSRPRCAGSTAAWVVQVRYQPGGLLEGRVDPRPAP